jgi:hypothetical protein
MKKLTNTTIKSVLLILALSSVSLTAQARDSLDALRTDLTTETATRTNADTAILEQINDESAARINSETSIQNQITTINQQFPRRHYVGERYAGGIVFYVDADGQHGLIAALADQSDGIHWRNLTYKFTNSNRDGFYTGAMNTAFIVYTQIGEKPAGDFAAKVATNYRVLADGVTPCTGITAETGERCYADWYLPSKAELYKLFHMQMTVGGFPNFSSYWSSTEYSTKYAWAKAFDNDPNTIPEPPLDKDRAARVRAIRAF